MQHHVLCLELRLSSSSSLKLGGDESLVASRSTDCVEEVIRGTTQQHKPTCSRCKSLAKVGCLNVAPENNDAHTYRCFLN